MAAIVTDEDFNQAAGQWLADNAIAGATIEKTDRQIFNAQYVEITPSTPILESALDVARLQVTSDTSLQNARDIALKQARKYILAQLRNPSPVATIYNTVRPVVDADPELPTMLNSLNLLATNGIPNWTLDFAGIDTDPERKRYLWLVLWLFPVLEV